MSMTAVPKAAQRLAFAGALPFVAGALGVWLLPGERGLWAGFALQTYGAVILSFLGGIHWGLAMAGTRDGTPDARQFGASVVPSLLGWVALLLPQPAGLVLLAFGFVSQFLYDRRAAARGFAPAWYPALRQPLTIVVVFCLAVAALGRTL
jgi:hypothetical protein